MNKNNLFKTILLFLIYFIYSYLISIITINMTDIDKIIITFIGDSLYLLGIILAYRKKLKNDILEIKKKYSNIKIIKIILISVMIIFLTNIILGMITDYLVPNLNLDTNTLAINNLVNDYLWYVIFKTMIFSVIAEELLYRESIKSIIKNKYIFIFISGVIYTIMNFIFIGFSGSYILIYLLIYFIPAIIESIIYSKNKYNIVILMLIKFAYNLIPTLINIFIEF